MNGHGDILGFQPYYRGSEYVILENRMVLEALTARVV
jgi:hypothetical protein